MSEALQRMELLIGEAGVQTLKNSTVLVVGVGGVGSFAIESLTRAGVGKMIIVDADIVAESNLNRQLHATWQTIGQSKTKVMKERIHTYAPDCEVVCIDKFYSTELNEELFAYQPDFVIDAIDTITSKADLIEACLKRKIPFISSMGMANRFDVTKVQITQLHKTYNDPLSKILRKMVKDRRLKGKINVVFSDELPFKQYKIINENGVTRKQQQPPASSPFVPATAGLAAGSYCMKALLEKK